MSVIYSQNHFYILILRQYIVYIGKNMIECRRTSFLKFYLIMKFSVSINRYLKSSKFQFIQLW